jgi:flagellar basal body-associated protein FliL
MPPKQRKPISHHLVDGAKQDELMDILSNLFNQHFRDKVKTEHGEDHFDEFTEYINDLAHQVAEEEKDCDKQKMVEYIKDNIDGADYDTIVQIYKNF